MSGLGLGLGLVFNLCFGLGSKFGLGYKLGSDSELGFDPEPATKTALWFPIGESGLVA